MSLLLDLALNPQLIVDYIKISRIRSSVPVCKNKNLERCYVFLGAHSRSFSTLIKFLDPKLRDFVCLMYLALRALDTIEDSVHEGDFESQKDLLANFYKRMYTEDKLHSYVHKDTPEFGLLKEFKIVAQEIKKLDPKLIQIIDDEVKVMGAGVSTFINRKCVTDEDYTKYTTYVAGTVGVALTKAFVETKTESEEYINQEYLDLAIHVGNFLQKTNIIKDFRCDTLEGRYFWPEVIYRRYVPGNVADAKLLLDPSNAENSHACIVHMVYDALKLVPHTLKYFSKLRDPHLLRFILVPQAMAICTLQQLIKDTSVFEGKNLKIKRGLTMRIMSYTKLSDYARVYLSAIKDINDVFRNYYDHPIFKEAFEASLLCSKIKVDVINCLLTKEERDVYTRNQDRHINTERYFLLLLGIIFSIFFYYFNKTNEHPK